MREIKQLKPLTDAQRGYVAGSIDVKGTMSLYPRDAKAWTLVSELTLKTDNYGAAYQLQEITGLGSVATYQGKTDRDSTSYRWKVTGRPLALLLKDVFPLMKGNSRSRAGAILRYVDEIRDAHYTQRRAISERTLEEWEWL